MRQITIILHSFQNVQDFVEVATVQPFRVVVGNDRTRVNAKSFMGMFSLDYSQPVQVRFDCGDEEYQRFRQALGSFVTED